MPEITIKSENKSLLPEFLFVKGEIKCVDLENKEFSIKLRNASELFIENEEDFDPFDVEIINKLDIDITNDKIYLLAKTDIKEYKLYIK